MIAPTPDQVESLSKIVGLRSALATAAEIGVAVGALELLESLGLVERWAHPAGDLWTLTPLGAEWYGVELDEATEGEPVWVRTRPDRVPFPCRLYGQAGSRSLGKSEPSRLAAPPCDPIEAAELAELAGLMGEYARTRDEGLLRRVERDAPRLAEEMRRRVVWDELLDAPAVVLGLVVERDRRIKPGRCLSGNDR